MARYEYTKPASKNEPCVICGKTDHCYRSYWGDDGVLHHCAKGGASTLFGRDGQEYYFKRESAGYFLYESVEQREDHRRKFIEEQKRLNPNFHYKEKKGGYVPSRKPLVEKERVEMESVKPLSNDRLHEVYSYLLSKLKLEESHKRALLSEWGKCAVHPELGEELLKRWPIRSLPMNDRARRASGAVLANMSRRELIDALTAKFGSLEGVPGFYLESFADKNGRQISRWQMVGLSGIVYPCYDSDGHIYRIRIGDEHPALREYERDENGCIVYKDHITRIYDTNGVPVEKKEKKPVYRYDYTWDFKTGEWKRKDLNSGEISICYSPQNRIYGISLTDKGYPKVTGKVEGKYKNFSSYYRKEKEQDGRIIIYNGYNRGCLSGSPISLYTKEGDDYHFLYVTEGEKKGMVINACLNCPVVSLPGVHTSGKMFEQSEGSHLHMSLIDHLRKKGLTAIVVVYDADKAVNDSVLAAEKNVINQCKEHGILVFSANWNPMFGKGADRKSVV